MSSVRKTRGRQKIEMKKMTNESNLQVTFSKRRNGLFKKASELCTLCGANVAIVVFSPGGKVFSFGHPNVETVINRYLTQVTPQNDGIMHYIEAQRSVTVCELNAHLTQLTNQLEGNKKHSEHLSYVRKEMQTHYWFASPIENMNRRQLEAIKKASEELKIDVARHSNMLMTQSNPPIAPQFFAGSTLSSSNMPQIFNSLPTPAAPAQLFPPPEFFQNPMMHAQLYDGVMFHHSYNNLGGHGHGFF